MAHQKQNTPGLGTEYEIFVPAYFALELNSNKDVKNFSIRSNVATDFGNMDDVIVDIELQNNFTLHFAFQLKHKEKTYKSLLPTNFETAKGDFSLENYCNEIKEIKNENKTKYHFILYTNANFDSARTEEVTQFTMVQGKQCPGNIFFNTSSNLENVYKFEVNDQTSDRKSVLKSDFEEILPKFSLYTCQKNFNGFKEDIFTILKYENAVLQYVELFRKWHQGVFTNKTIDKKMMNIHLVDIFLSPYVIADHRFFSAQNDRLDLFEAAVRQFDVTVINESRENFIGNIVKSENFENSTAADPESEKRLLQLAKEYKLVIKNTMKLEEDVKLKILCYFSEHLLIVDFNRNSENLLYQCLKLYQVEEEAIKFVLFGTGISIEKLRPLQVFQTLEDLSKTSHEHYQRIINDCKVSLQGRDKTSLKQLFDSLNEVCSSIETKEVIQMLSDDVLIGTELETLPSYYIPRKVSTTLLDINTIQSLIDDKNLIIIINMNNEFEKIQKMFNEKELTIMTAKDYLTKEETDKNIVICCNEEDGRKCFNHTKTNDRQRYSNKKILKMVTNDHFMLIMSTNYLIDYEDTYIEEEIDENNIHNFLNAPVNILSGQPGMGKSTMMKYLNNKHSLEFWTVSIDLKAHHSFLEKRHSIQEVLVYFTKSSNEDSTLSNKLKKVFEIKGKVVFYFDGLDELEPVCVGNILDYIKELSRMGYRVWVSSRQNLEEQLRHTFNIFVINIVELTEEEQKTYVQDRLKSQYKQEEIEKIIGTIFSSNQIVNNRQILGIPLQLFIITQIFLDENGYYVNVKNNLFVLTVMYKIFFDGRYKHVLEKLKSTSSFSVIGPLEDYLENYEVAALQSVLDDDDFAKLKLNLRKNERFLNRIKTDKDPLGIIVTLNTEGKAVFEHYTFAEYFACVFLSNNFDKAKLLENHLFSDRYKNVMLIFNIMLAEENPLHLTIIYKNFYQVDKHLNDNTVHDKAGRNPLHIFATLSKKCTLRTIETFVDKKVGQDYILKKVCLSEPISTYTEEKNNEYKNLIKKLIKFDPYEPDCLFEEDAFHYAIVNNCLFTVEIILETYGMSRKGFEDLKKYKYVNSPTITYYSTLWGYPNLLSVALDKKNSSIIKMKDSKGKGLLNVASTSQSFKLLTDYYDGIENRERFYDDKNNIFYPPLHAAIRAKYVEMVKHLVETQKEQDIYAVHMAIETQHFEIFKILLQSEEEAYIEHLATQQFHLQLELLAQLSEIGWVLICRQGDTLLHFAIRVNNSKVINYILKHNIDLNVKNDHGETPLMIAVQNNNSDVIKVLIEKGANINESNDRGLTPLMKAIANDNFHVVKLLVDNGAHLETKNKIGATPLHIAARHASLGIYNLILDNGVNVDILDSKKRSIFYWASEGGNEEVLNLFRITDLETDEEVLHKAAVVGNCNVINRLLDKGANINFKNRNGATPVLRAAQRGCVDAVTFLIQKGADINCISNNQLDLWTVAFGNVRTFKTAISVMLQKGANPNKKIINNYNTTPLSLAIAGNCLDTTRQLLDYGANVNDLLALREAVLNGRIQFLELLLEKGAKIDPTKLLNGAISDGMYEIAKWCIEKEADLNDVNEEEETVLHLVLKQRNSSHDDKIKSSAKRFIETILNKNVNPNLKNKRGETPLYYAIEGGDDEVVQVLIQNGAEVNDLKAFVKALEMRNIHINKLLLDEGYKLDSKNETYIMPAAGKSGNFEITNLFLRNGFNINAPNSEGETALILAATEKHFKLVKFLVLNGADVNCISNKKETIWKYLDWNDRELINLVLGSNINPCLKNSDGETVLYYAIKNEDVNFVISLLKDNADLDTNDDKALYTAVCKNNTDIINHLEQNGYELNTYKKKRTRQLFEDDRNQIFLRLFNKHVTILSDDYIYIALHLAVYLGDCSNLELIKEDIDFESVDVCNDIYPLHFAMRNDILQFDLVMKMTAWIDNEYVEKQIWELEEMRSYLLNKFPIDPQFKHQRKHKYLYEYLTKPYDLFKNHLPKTCYCRPPDAACKRSWIDTYALTPDLEEYFAERRRKVKALKQSLLASSKPKKKIRRTKFW